MCAMICQLGFNTKPINIEQPYNHTYQPDTAQYVSWLKDLPPIEKIDTPTVTFNTIIPFVLHHEGSRFVHDKSINEVSRRGITLSTYKRYYGKGDYNSIRNLSEAQATAIYKKLFWDANNLDSLIMIGYGKTAAVLFDSGINIGPGRANRLLQKHLHVKRTGLIGSTTLDSLRVTRISDDSLSTLLISCRRSHYSRLIRKNSVYKKYQRGWNNRLDAMEDFTEEI